jgi:hypothetical protein
MQLTRGTFDDLPVCSPDGKWIYYVSQYKPQRVSIDGGVSKTVSEMEVFVLDVSRDGKLLGFWAGDIFGVINTENGKVGRRFPADPAWEVLAGSVLSRDSRRTVRPWLTSFM